MMAPWTQEQVDKLNKWQNAGLFHPFTCGNGHTLVATKDGWICPSCPEYHQDWAHDFMVGLIEGETNV
jgi:hypothetical protein